MELLDRYLHAVKFWLPKVQRQDIIAELSEDIRSQIEEKESGLGRKLNDAEVAAMLKQLGRPVVVASRYLPQQHLIGPVLFPVYKFVLKIVMLCYLVPWILTWIALMIYDPAYRAAHSGRALLDTVRSSWAAFWFTTCLAVGAVTIVFVVLERAQAKSDFLDNWDPRKLPPVRDPNRIARGASIFEIVTNVVVTAWLVEATWSPLIFDRFGIRITLAPVWRPFLGAIVLISLANLAFSAVNLARPYWTSSRAGLRLAVDILGSGVFAWLCKVHIVAEFTASGLSAAEISETTNAINLWIAKMFPYAIGVGVIVLAFDLYRIIRLKRAATASSGSMAARVLPTSASG